MINACISKLIQVKISFGGGSSQNQPAIASSMAPPKPPPIPNLVQPTQSVVKFKNINSSISSARSLLKHVPQSAEPKLFDIEVQEKVR